MLTKISNSLFPPSSPRARRVLALAALLAATVILGLAQAGDLEPPGPPGPTMKTLDEIPPTWSRLLPADDGDASGCDSSRFECLGPNDAWVLDHQTGLVWQRQVGSIEAHDWALSRTCLFYSDGAWRLPTPFELGSLRATQSASDARGLPVGHPFLIAGTGPIDFWTMTSSAADPSQAWFYRFDDSPIVASFFPQEAPKTAQKQRWCVRASSPGMAVY